MSLKFAALGDLTFLPRTSARADEQDRNLGPVAPHEPILISFGCRESTAAPEKPDAGAIRRFLVKTRQAFTSR
jgi:hypothetical protein